MPSVKPCLAGLITNYIGIYPACFRVLALEHLLVCDCAIVVLLLLMPLYACKGYDTAVIPMVVTVILMSLAAVAALAGLLIFQFQAAFYARPLNFHTDVLRQQ